MQLTHKIILLQHTPHAERKTHRNAHRKALRNSHNNQSHSNHNRRQNELSYLDKACTIRKSAACCEENQTTDHNQGSKNKTCDRYPPAELTKLLIQRCFLAAALLSNRNALALFCIHSDSANLIYSIALNDSRTAKKEIRNICSIRIEISLHSSLVCIWFSCEIRLINSKRRRLKKITVSRNLITAFKLYDITHDHILLQNIHKMSRTKLCLFPESLDWTRILHLIEDIELSVSLKFENETDSRRKKKSYEDTGRFNEYRPALAHIDKLICSNEYRKCEND